MAQKLEFRLHIKSPDTHQDFTVPIGTTIIGRDPNTNLPLVFPLVSRRHAQLVCKEDECEIMDLGSANGTFVNTDKLEPNVPVKLSDQAQIMIGPFEITCEVVPIGAAPAEALHVEAQPSEPAILIPAEEVKAQEAAVPPAEAGAPAVPAQEAPKPTRKAAKKAAQEEIQAPPPPPPEPPAPAEVEPSPLQRYTIPPGLSIQSLSLLDYLPGIYQTDFMSRFLALFESILVPIEWNIDNFDLFLSPDTSPTSFLPWLANWYEIVYDNSWNEEQRRALLKEAHMIYARRGTRWALSRILEIYTGQKPEIIEFSDDREPFTFTVKLASGNDNLNRELVERVIDASKPAQTTYKLIF